MIKEIVSLQRKVELLLAERERVLTQLDHIEYQIIVYEKKIWRAIEERKNQETNFADRNFNHNNRRMTDLLDDKDRTLRYLDSIDHTLSQWESETWRMVEMNILVLFLFLLITIS
jgi:hypothetical protein